MLEKNRAVEVSYYDQRSKSSVTVKGKKVMANIDPVNIFGKMLPEQYREPGMKGLKPATSLYTVYVVFKEAVSKHYKTNYSNFIVSEADLNCESKALWDDISKRDVEERPFVFVDYSNIDSGLVDEGDDRGFGVLTSISELSEWEVLDDDAYGVKKETLAKRLCERLEVHYPGIRELLEYYEVSTPETIKRYIRSSNCTASG